MTNSFTKPDEVSYRVPAGGPVGPEVYKRLSGRGKSPRGMLRDKSSWGLARLGAGIGEQDALHGLGKSTPQEGQVLCFAGGFCRHID